MERMTHEADFGLEDWEETLFFVKSDPNGAYNIIDIAKYQGEPEFDEILKNVALRLAAYENTGLEPENVISAVDMAKVACALEELNAYKKLGSLARLRELAEADREGRCVVQKFAPGSEVWIVERDEDGEATEVSGVVFVVSVSGVAIVSPSINGCSDLDFILGDFVEETASSFSGFFSGYAISDCYKSHEEAEAALRREQDG